MTTLDDRLLGEKLQYYYSSSEDEDSEREEGAEDGHAPSNSLSPGEVELSGDGGAINTGLYSNSESTGKVGNTFPPP